MISKEAIEEIKKGVQQPQVVEIGDFKHLITDKSVNSKIILPSTPTTLTICTLSGIITYMQSADRDNELWQEGERYLVHIEEYNHVKVISGLDPIHMMRREYIAAINLGSSFNYGRYLTIEDFIISVMSSFVQDDNVKIILNFVSSIQSLHQNSQDDDGASQTVTVKKSITTVGTQKVPNPIELRPFVTFPEILQPARQFVFRIKQETPDQPIRCALFTVDSDAWRAIATSAVREYLIDQIDATDIPAVVIS